MHSIFTADVLHVGRACVAYFQDAMCCISADYAKLVAKVVRNVSPDTMRGDIAEARYPMFGIIARIVVAMRAGASSATLHLEKPSAQTIRHG